MQFSSSAAEYTKRIHNVAKRNYAKRFTAYNRAASKTGLQESAFDFCQIIFPFAANQIMCRIICELLQRLLSYST